MADKFEQHHDVPAGSRPHFGHWIHSYRGTIDAGRKNNALDGPQSGYIPGCAGPGRYPTLEEAKAAAEQLDQATGITWEPDDHLDGAFTLRAGNFVLPSPAGVGEVSWCRVKEYPGCAQRFRGGHAPGACVHGVGANQQHYTCCGRTDVDAECPVKHLPLGVKLITGFLSDAEQRDYVERTLQEPMALKETTLNFLDGRQLVHLPAIKNRANEWLRRLTHGNDHCPFTWANGHFYNGAADWDANELGTQPVHRDRDADVDRTLGVSIGAGMWFHYSLRDETAVKAAGGSAGGAFEHHVHVRSGDALLFDGMTLTHAADNLEPGTEPAWWAEVLDGAGAGHVGNRVDYLPPVGAMRSLPRKHSNCFLSTCLEPDESRRFHDSLEHAVEELKRKCPHAGGITQEESGRFSVRQGKVLKVSAQGESSYLVSERELLDYRPSRLFIGLR